MKYNMTSLEKTIKSIYEKIGINEPDVPIDEIAKRLGVELFYGSKTYRIGPIICLDSNLSKEKMREAFAHELCHCLYHIGNQLNMYDLYFEYQEFKAYNFAMHFCIPTFMLLKIKLPKYRNMAAATVSNIFCVTNEFALKRLEHYEKQIFGTVYHKLLANTLKHERS